MTLVESQAPSRRVVTELLLQGGRLLLEYSEATDAIHRALTTTARALVDEDCHVEVTYRGVAVWVAGQPPALGAVRELRYNMAVLARVRTILEQVRAGERDPVAALASLLRVEAETPRHSRWLAALALGVAASALAMILGADAAAAGVAGVATALGLLARQELGRRHFALLTLPLAAALLGALLGGITIRLGWTRTPELVLVVPALMIVPGPHLINGLLDLIDNHLPMALARLGLAAGILLASALGIVLGLELTGVGPTFAGPVISSDHLNLPRDAALAAIVACGFAVFYNTAAGQLWMAAVSGMAGHGLRYAVLEAGCRPDVAIFLGGFAVGAVAAGLARASRTPVAVIGFAGAVTMMPGVDMYQALGGALRLARYPGADDPAVAAKLGNGFQAFLLVSALTLGFLLGARAVRALLSRTISSPHERGASPT